MLRGMRGNGGGKEENQGNYSSKIEGDARFHEEKLRQKGWLNWQVLFVSPCSVVTSTSLPEVTVHTTWARGTPTKVQGSKRKPAPG